MAKVNVNGTWKEVSSIKVKVNGTWEDVSTAYKKMSGTWQEIYKLVVGKVLSYYGTATPLSVTRSSLASTTVGDYALFGGGSNSDTVDAYDTSLVRTTPTPLSVARDSLSATTVGDYALFGGGSSYRNTVDAYSSSLVRTTPTPLSVARNGLASTTVGDYALFGGGYTKTLGSYRWYFQGHAYTTARYYATTNVVDAYNTSLVRTIATSLSSARGYLASTTVGDYALFGGGKYTKDEYQYMESNSTKWASGSNPNTGTVDAYNTSLVRTTLSSIVARNNVKTAKVGGYALFLGNILTAEVFDTLLVKTTIAVQVSRTWYATTEIGDFTIIAGSGNTVDVYDTSLVRTTPTPLSVGRSGLTATTVGDYALFGGGSDVVDVYQYI